MRRILVNRDFLSGVLFLAFGILAAWVGRNYAGGTAQRMGPGYFPAIIAWGLIVLGLMISVHGMVVALAQAPVRDRTAATAMSRWRIVQPFLVLAAAAVFGILAPRYGLVVAVPATVAVVAAARGGIPPLELLAQVISMTLFVALVFIKGLGVALPIWPW